MATIMGIIFFLSHQPGDIVQLPEIPFLDKIAHVVAYAILAGTFIYALQPFALNLKRSAVVVTTVLFCIFFGLADEYHQSFIPGRFVSGWDVVADAIGGLVAGGAWLKMIAGKREKECS